MQYLKINDSYINFKSCKWVIENLLSNGCDQFAYYENESECLEAKPNQVRLRACFDKYFISNNMVETYFYNNNNEPWHKVMSIFQLNRNSFPIILDNMGRHLLDFNTHYNLGVGNWQFYKQGKLLAGCSIDDDVLIVSNPCSSLTNKLDKLCVMYELSYT